MKVLITGATGLVGKEITKLCHQSNIDVNYLTTNKSKLKSDKNYRGYYWNPIAGEIDSNCLSEVEVIIHLAGATIAKRWTKKYKKEIIESRVNSTLLILDTLKNSKHSIRHIVSASAIGIYPDSFQKYYMENSTEQASGFLGEVVQKWEAANGEFNTLNIDVSLLRIGLVLSSNGGAFSKLARPIQLGVGAVFGTGKQWQSWIHIQDLARLFLFVIEEELTGVYNAVAPNPVSNDTLIRSIGEKMKKKILLPNIPKFAMQLILGEMHVLLFSSQRVCSDKSMKAGFQFTYENITQAIDDLI